MPSLGLNKESAPKQSQYFDALETIDEGEDNEDQMEEESLQNIEPKEQEEIGSDSFKEVKDHADSNISQEKEQEQ